jgi:transposase
MSQVTVISGVERRRVWTDEQKRALVGAACEPGASVAEIARRADLRPSQLYRWRRDLADAVPGFAALMVSREPDQDQVARDPAVIVVELGRTVLRIAADAPPALVVAVMRSLRR